MTTPEPVKAAMGDGARAQPDAVRALLRDPRAPPRDPREGPRRRNGIPCDDEAPVVVNGGMQGLFAAFSTLLDPGDEVLLFSPYWTPIVDLIGYHQAHAVLVPTAAARREGSRRRSPRRPRARTKLLYWNSPNNPTGDVFSRAETEEVAAFARERGLAVISDEAYEDLVYEGEPSRRDRVAARNERADDHLLHAVEELLDDGMAARLRHRAEARYQTAIKTVVLYTTNGVSTPTQWAGVEALDARHRVRRGVASRAIAPGATVSSRACRPRASRSSRRAPPSISSRRRRPGCRPTRARPRASCSTRRRSRPCPASSSAPRARATCGSRSRSPRT